MTAKLKASFSQDLVNQLINIYFPKGSLIYEPFTGIGTTQLSCIENGCDYIGSELVKNHYEIALKRVKEKRKEKDLQTGTLFGNEMEHLLITEHK